MSKNNNAAEKPDKVKSEADDHPVPFMIRVVRILESLGSGNDTLTDISNECNFNLSTTHRLLHTLREPGFTVYDESSRRYYPGPLITRLASRVQLNHKLLIACSLSEMQRLSDLTGETIALRVFMRDAVLPSL